MVSLLIFPDDYVTVRYKQRRGISHFFQIFFLAINFVVGRLKICTAQKNATRFMRVYDILSLSH